MEQEDMTERDLTLSVLLPEGHERTVTVHGSKPVMDVLVILCAQYHLNPSDHVIELFSTNHNKLKFQPSSVIGSLEAELVTLKPKRSDIRKAPNIPVATVRLLINYRKSHKAVVRVSPRVPLAELMPAVCEKCEMDPETTVLLRDSQSEEPLDLTKTLNDYGIRDLYAKAVSQTDATATLTTKGSKRDSVMLQEKILGEKENRGFLSLFRRSKKSAEETGPNTNPISAAASLVLKDQHTNNGSCDETNPASSAPSSEMPKKRRAPQPPSMLGSQSASCELNSGQQSTLPSTDPQKQGVLSRILSTESSLKRNKRKAPPPPPTSTSEKESSYTGSFLEDTKEEDRYPETSLDQSGEFNPNCLSIQKSSSLMTEVLSELIDRMKTMEHDDVSSDRSVSRSPSASNLPQASASLDSDPIAPPGCELLRDGSHRDGLTTFTVVPRRRPQSTRQYEFLLMMETIPRDTEGNLEGSSSGSRSDEKMEMSSQEMVVLKERDEFENIKKMSTEMGVTEKHGKFSLNTDEETHSPEGRNGMEEQDERDWVEEYRERRRRFLCDGGKETKFKTSTNSFDEDMMEHEPPPPPQLPVCWEEKDGEMQSLKKVENFGKKQAREDKPANGFTIQTPNPSRYDPQHDPPSDPTPTQEPYWDVKLSSDLHSTSDTPATTVSPHNQQPTSDRVLESNLHPSFELSSPNSASLFALAVSRRAQRLGNGVFPLIPAARRTSSPAQALKSLGSHQTSSQKLYFQNLISQEFVTLNIPASQGVCSEAPPISKAPPMVVMPTQARRRAWSSFSHMQVRTLEDV